MSSTDLPTKNNNLSFAALGSGGDIESLVFLVLMQSAVSAQDDLKAIMEQVKKLNDEKQKLRELMSAVAQDLLFSKQALSEDQLRTLITYLMKPC